MTITIELLRTTDLAVLVKYHNNELWVPKSVIDDGDSLDELDVGSELDIDIKDWFCEKEGIE